ncbi:hypothetical protein F4803DRAFT_553449 [Xylaria telfairii]|nr:hypothetical protein F4803DRAFT_553449 [Xylaria telfairii]
MSALKFVLRFTQYYICSAYLLPDSSIVARYDESVHGIIDALRTRQTSDPKDRAFASYAILTSLGVGPRELDYGKELELIYREHFISLLQWKSGILNLIAEANWGHRYRGPSLGFLS